MRRIVSRIVPLTAAAVLAVCGGRIDMQQPRGWVFVPGSKCAGYDVAAFFASPAPSCKPTTSGVSEICEAWARSRVPPGYPAGAECRGQLCAGAVGTGSAYAHPEYGDFGRGVWLFCERGPAGDAYCQAFYRQFVLGDAVVRARCEQGYFCSNAPEHGIAGPSCREAYAYCKIPFCEFALPVTRNGEDRCEAPCTPPGN